MPATPADIALYTVDGIVVTSENASVKSSVPDAKDFGTGEVEMFFDTSTDAQAMLDEKFSVLSVIGRLHEGVEIEDRLEIGGAIPITPAVPVFTVIDDARSINTTARLRAYVFDMSTDRYSLEVLG